MKGVVSLAWATLLAVGAGGGALAASAPTAAAPPSPSAAGKPSTPPRAIPSSAAALSAAAPRSAAEFARQVLLAAPVPAGSKLISSVPAPLAEPLELPGIPGLVDVHRIYATPDPPGAAEANVFAHRPPGAKRTQTGSFTGPGGSGSGFVITLPTSGPNEYLAQLAYSLVRRGSGSTLRVDAQIVFEPDRPMIETIPRGASAELTGYAVLSLTDPSSGPVSARLDATGSDRLAGALNVLPVAPQPACAEDAVEYRIVFQGTGGARYDLTGEECARTIEVSRNGRQLAALHDAGCSVLRIVDEYVPRHATGTRQAASQCRSEA